MALRLEDPPRARTTRLVQASAIHVPLGDRVEVPVVLGLRRKAATHRLRRTKPPQGRLTTADRCYEAALAKLKVSAAGMLIFHQSHRP